MKKNIVDYKIIDVFIGSKLKEERKKRGIRLVDFADSLGISKQRYVNYESASRSMPMDIYKKACKLLKLDPVDTFKQAQDRMREEVFKDADLQEEQ